MIMRRTSILIYVLLLSFFGFLQVKAQDPVIELISVDEMLATKDAIGEAINAHDVDQIMSLFPADAVFDYAPVPAPMTTNEEIGAFFANLFQAWPDYSTVYERLLVSGDMVITEHGTTATHLGEFIGVPATGASTQGMHLDIWEFEDGELSKVTTYVDMSNTLVQIGVMPAPDLSGLAPSFVLPEPEPTGMSALEAAENIVSVYNSHDLDAYAKLIHSDAEIFLATLGTPIDRDMFITILELYFLAYSDLEQDILRTVDMGDGWAFVEVVFAGINDGPYFGTPATGNYAETRGAWIAQFDEDGLMTDIRVYWDELTGLTQLGLFPPLPPVPEYPPIPYHFVQDEITSPALEGNLLGDSATRSMVICLPATYDLNPEKRYPTVYLLHGYTGDPRMFVNGLNAAMETLTGMDFGIDIYGINNELLASGEIGEVIIVMPDGRNAYGGSWYEDSEVLGDYRTYIASDLVNYIDSKYRTIPDREHRGIAGHSMGGYGAISLAIEYPDVFGAVAALSPGTNDIDQQPTVVERFVIENPDAMGLPIMVSSDEDVWNIFLTNFDTNILYSMAAAYSPNPDNPPYYVDLPVSYPDKTIIPEVWQKWQDQDLLSQIEQNGANLANTPVFIDVGVGPVVIMAEEPLDTTLAALDAQGISYIYEEFDGDHISHLRYQLASALKFLSPHIGAIAPSQEDANKVIARRPYEDVINQQNIDAVDEIFAIEHVEHMPPNPDLHGPEGMRAYFESLLAAFPDSHVIIDDQVAAGNMVATRWTIAATHTGDFMGIPATGIHETTTGVCLFHIEDGMAIEDWTYADFLGLMQQLGAIEPGRPSPENYTWGASSEVIGEPGDPEANIAFVIDSIERVWNQQDLDAVDETFSPDFVCHSPVEDISPWTGTEITKQVVAAYLETFPDMHVTNDDVFAEGDKVVVRWTTTGTHSSELQGISPTGEKVTFKGITIYRMADGMIVENWWAWDALGLMQQVSAAAQEMANKEVSRRDFEEGLNQGNLEIYDEIIAPEAVLHTASGDIIGLEGIKAFVSMYLIAFPDLHFTIEDMVAEGDLVVIRWGTTGTHQGELMGIPATGVSTVGTGVSIQRISDGQIQESWLFGDDLGTMQQLGVMPPTRETYTWGVPSEVTGDPGDPQTNMATLQNMLGGVLAGNMDAIDEVFIADYVMHDPSWPMEIKGPEGFKQWTLAMFEPNFSNSIIIPDDIIAEGDKIVVRWTWTGTHTGEFMGIPPTGRQLSVTGTSIHRFADGMFVESWASYDSLGMMQQLTAAPPEYEVYALMVSMFDDGGAVFRFSDESDPEVFAKNREDAPISCIYIKGPDVDLIYGPSPSRSSMESLGAEDPFYVAPEVLLGRIGVSPEDIDYVVIDHTCFDHPGSVDLFPNATVIVQKAMFDQPNPLVFPLPDGLMFNLAQAEDYAKLEEVRADDRLLIVDGDAPIVPGIMTYHTPGHTYENNTLTVNTKDGTVVLTGDSCYTYLNLEHNIVPMEWVVTDAELTLQSYEKIRQLIGDSDALLVPGHDMDIYTRYTKIADRVVKIELPEGEYTNVFFMELNAGLNMISLPLKPVFAHDARSFAAELGATVVIKYDEALRKFIGFTPDAPNDGFAIEGGKGYIVNTPSGGVIPFSGAAWTNDPPVAAAPPVQTSTAWAFVVSGAVLDGDMMSVSDGNYSAIVKNPRTGDTFTESVDPDGYFAAAWADLSRKIVVGAGDQVEVMVVDSGGNVVSGPFIHGIELDAIRNAAVDVRLKLGDIIPAESALLQNYPNPFNPETWLPYHLHDADNVSISIYSATGQIIKTLDLGYRDAGVYVSRSKAAYWDGRNKAGEKVASGTYFYCISSGDFLAVRKMVVKK